jgi:transposase, IS30 family
VAMQRSYSHVSRVERGQIMFLKMWGLKVSEIARKLARDKSTISRELRRNVSPYATCYTDESAQLWAERRRKQASRRSRLKNEQIRDYVEQQLVAGWSPELIAGRIRLDLPGETISHEAIYQYVYHLEEPARTEYIRCLLRSHRRRRKRSTGKGLRKSRIPNRISISERPAAVATREEHGHWEGDSLVSSRNSTVLYSLVERKTRMVLLTRVRGRDGKRTAKAMIRKLRPLPTQARQTLTMDNGLEHSRHEDVTRALGIRCFFCDPYSAWQRPTNENRNGLIRHYFPKGTDFARLTRAEIARVELAINSRPMKCLGYRTPLEAAAHFVALHA